MLEWVKNWWFETTVDFSRVTIVLDIDMGKRELLRRPCLDDAAPKTIAVAGGAGFIGSHLCEALAWQGHRVVCLDNFLTGRAANVERLQGVNGFTVVTHDVTRPYPDDLPRFDQIYNLACPASPPHYQADRVKTALTCAQGALHGLERGARDGATVFQASTSEVYGDPDVHPQTETYFGNVNPVGPRSCYDEGKRFAETLFSDYGEQHGIDVRIVRIFNTYGPRMQADDGRVVSNFIVQALRGENITIHGDGGQTRSFCFVDDLVEGCLRLMNSDPGLRGPVNIGNPAEITVGALAKMIIKLTGSPSKIEYRPLPVDDPRRRKPDIARAHKGLGWSPSVSLDEGLERTIRYFAKALRLPAAARPAAPALPPYALPSAVEARAFARPQEAS